MVALAISLMWLAMSSLFQTRDDYRHGKCVPFDGIFFIIGSKLVYSFQSHSLTRVLLVVVVVVMVMTS